MRVLSESEFHEISDFCIKEWGARHNNQLQQELPFLRGAYSVRKRRNRGGF